jgi:branched-chain amino acid transport system substrate-binding protein
VAGPTTGSAAAYGENQLKGVEIAVTEINESGGINGRPLEVVPGDDQCDPTEAANVAQRFASDPEIVAVIGHVCSSATLAAGPIYDTAGLTAVTGSSTNPTVTDQGWTHVFRTITSDADQGPEIAKLGIDTLGLEKFAIVYANHDYGRGLLDFTVPAIEERGGEVVAQETFAPGETTDFSAQLTKIAQAEPDALILLTDYAEGGLIAGQRVQHGLGDVPVIASAGNANIDYVELAGGEPAEGNMMVVYYNSDSSDPATVEFNEKFMGRWGELPTAEIPVFNYELVYILKEALEQGATRETMPEVLSTIEYNGPTGLTKFDEKGQVSGKGQDVIIIQDGEFKTFEPSERLDRQVGCVSFWLRNFCTPAI